MESEFCVRGPCFVFCCAPYRARWTSVKFNMSDTSSLSGDVQRTILFGVNTPGSVIGQTPSISLLLVFQTLVFPNHEYFYWLFFFCRLCVPAQLPVAAVTPKPRNNWSEHKENVLKCVRLPRGDGFRLDVLTKVNSNRSRANLLL